MATDPAPPNPDPIAAPIRPGFTPDQLLPLLGEVGHYRLLGLLLDGAPHTATELGRAIGKSRMATSKHLATLRTAGFVEPCAFPQDRRSTGFRLVPAFVPAPGAPRELDFGWCVLRF
jgi:hypothetical protein